MSEQGRKLQNRVLQPDDVLKDTIGDFGLWQFRLSVSMALLKFPIAWFQLGIVFLAPPTEFWCKRPPEYASMPVDKWKELITPNNTRQSMGLVQGSCKMWDPEVLQNAGAYVSTKCQWGYEYNTTTVNSSIVSEWDLVCERERLVDLAQIILMFGVLIGNLTFGIAADKYGRKKALMIGIFIQSVFGILSAVVPWYPIFLATRFILALANGGTMIASFVMCIEGVGGKWRTVIPILYQIPFGIGNSIMAGIAYLLRDWRAFQLTLSSLSAVFLIYIWCIPESPRWLLAVGHRNEATQVLEKAAKMNGKDPSAVKTIMANFPDIHDEKPKPSMDALFRTPQLRRKTLLLFLNWMICGISFYAFSQYMGHVSSNLYTTVALSGLVSIPGTVLCIYIVQKFGRRCTIASAHVATATCFLLIIAVPHNVYKDDWPRILLSGLGIVGMSISMPALYLYTGELFPTVLRNAGVGGSVMCSRIGSMVAPLVIALSTWGPWIPLVILGVLTYIEAVLVVPLPETKGCVLPDTLSDAELFDKKRSKEDRENCNYMAVPNELPAEDR